MKAQFITTLTVFLLLAGCSSTSKPLQAPCSYSSRSNCGAVVPLQQTLSISGAN